MSCTESASFEPLSEAAVAIGARNREIAPLGVAAGVQRLWYGALTRSARTGLATTLYFGYRELLGHGNAGAA